MFWQILASVVLMMLSACFSGLTLGLMGLDQMGLRMVIESGMQPDASPVEVADAKHAGKIFPFRSRGNLLLCTLLFGNVAVNSLLSIIMADLTSGLTGFLLSAFGITIFGEIVPQAVCSRHPLAIGAFATPLVYIFTFVTFVVAWPMSQVLDNVLGEEIGTIYSRNQLKRLVMMYSRIKESEFHEVETNIVTGALDFSRKNVGSCMTPIGDTFMLDIEDKLTFETVYKIFLSGHSRVPVFESHPNDKKEPIKIVGLLFVKELILVDPEDDIPVRNICHHWFGTDIPVVFEDCKTAELIKVFKTGRSHMALVKSVVQSEDSDPWYQTVGIITLEDLIEEILQDEIEDEMDYNERGMSRRSKKAMQSDIAGGGELPESHPLLQYLADKNRQDTLLPNSEVDAITMFLSGKYHAIFGDRMMANEALNGLVRSAKVLRFAADEGRQEIYLADTETSVFTLVLDGQMKVQAGRDGFESICGPWSVFGLRIFETKQPISADWTAAVDSVGAGETAARLLQIDLEHYLACVKARDPYGGEGAAAEHAAKKRALRKNWSMQLKQAQEKQAAGAAGVAGSSSNLMAFSGVLHCSEQPTAQQSPELQEDASATSESSRPQSWELTSIPCAAPGRARIELSSETK